MSDTQIEISDKESETENLDLLGRDEFINSVIEYVNYYSDQKKSISFSINGEWGSGKTWVIDNIINKLYEIQTEETYSDKFCVFKYNAWDYDYYEEPLIALTIAIKEQIENKDAVFIKSDKGRAQWQATKKVIKESAYKELHKLLDNASKIKIVPVTPVSTSVSMLVKILGLIGNNVVSIKENIDEEIKKQEDEIRNYDEYFDLKTLIKNVKESFSKLTGNRTVVIVVDELDRCLPEYAVKVLERMHHLCEGINNIQFIYAIDDKQLSNTVKQIFGDEVSVRSYLAKFMNFSLRLPNAPFNELVESRYKDFNSIFNFLYSEKCSLYEIISKPLGKIPIRSKIQILEKVKIINQLLLHNKKDIDFSILLFELFIAYCDYFGIDLKIINLKLSGIDKSYPTPQENAVIEEINIVYRNLMKNVHISQDENGRSTYYIDKNMTVNDYLPLYFSIFCNHFSALIKYKDVSISQKRKITYEILNNFWYYYKTMEL